MAECNHMWSPWGYIHYPKTLMRICGVCRLEEYKEV